MAVRPRPVRHPFQSNWSDNVRPRRSPTLSLLESSAGDQPQLRQFHRCGRTVPARCCGTCRNQCTKYPHRMIRACCPAICHFDLPYAQIFAAPRHCGKFIGRLTVMRAMNELLATGPFDLYELQLFHLVAEHRNFTKAGQAAGLTQSAITRQIAGMEARVGVPLFERTTRFVNLTAAGAALYARSGAILAGVDDAVKSLRTRFELGPAVLRVGIARTIGLAYLPGFFRKFQKAHPEVQAQVTHHASAFILA